MPVFFCKSCGQRMRAVGTMIGRQCRCRSCNALVAIPSGDEPAPNAAMLREDAAPLPEVSNLPASQSSQPSVNVVPVQLAGKPFTDAATKTARAASKPVTIGSPQIAAKKLPLIAWIGGGVVLAGLGLISIGVLGPILFGSKAGRSHSKVKANTGDYVYSSAQERSSEYIQNVRRANYGGEIEWLGSAQSADEEKVRRNVEALAQKNRASSNYLRGVRDQWTPAK